MLLIVLYRTSFYVQEIKIIGMPVHSFEEEAFYGLSNLQSLCMMLCEITEMPPLNPVKSILKILRVAHNQITFIPEDYFFAFPKLISLDLAYNSLTSVSQLHPLSATLQMLDLGSNRLQYFPTSFHNTTYTTLSILILRKNKLKECRLDMLNNFPGLNLFDLIENSISFVNDLRHLHRVVELTVCDLRVQILNEI